MKLAATLALALWTVAAGCKKDTMRAPPAPRLDGSIESGPIMPPPRRDAGPPYDAGEVDAGEDAGAVSSDAGVLSWCVSVASGDLANRATVTSAGLSLSFDVNTAFATWSPASCASPTVVVGLSDATCSVTSGHRLTFAFDGASIDASLVSIGAIGVMPSDPRLSIAYVRPATAGMSETWGTCAGASGSVELTDVGDTPGSRIAGTFDLVLTDCTDPFTTADAQLNGSFDVTLEQAFADVCAP